MAKEKKEHCPKCNGTIYAAATDKSNKHYCQAKGCGHVWIPGLEVSGRTDLVLKNALKENIELKAEINRVRDQNGTLKDEVKALKEKYEPKAETPAKNEDEIFT